jgi:hypothetical protein
MPFNFPSSPSTGNTYSFGDIIWEYNGYAWEKLDLLGTGIVGPTGATGQDGSGAPGNNDVGVLYLKGNTFETTIPSINGRSIVVGNVQTGTLFNFIKDPSTNSLKYTGAGGRFHIICTFNFYNGSQDICGFYIGHNKNIASALDPNADRISESEIYANSANPSTQPIAGTIQTILDLNTDDRIFLIVQNKESTNSILVEFMKFIVVPLTSERGATGPQGPTGSSGSLVSDYVISVNGLTGDIINVPFTNQVNYFSAIQSFDRGITISNSVGSNVIDVIAATDGTGLRIAQAGSGSSARVGSIRLGRSTTNAANVLLEGYVGQFRFYNGITGTNGASPGTNMLTLSTTNAIFGVPISGVTFTGNIIGVGATFSGNLFANNIVNSVNGMTGNVVVSGSSGVTQEDNITIFIDARPDDISTGNKGYKQIAYDCIPIEWYIISGQTGNIQFDVKKSSFENYPTTTSIVGSDYPGLSGSMKNSNIGITLWSGMSAGDVVDFIINSNTGIQSVGLFIKIRRTS